MMPSRRAECSLVHPATVSTGWSRPCTHQEHSRMSSMQLHNWSAAVQVASVVFNEKLAWYTPSNEHQAAGCRAVCAFWLIPSTALKMSSQFDNGWIQLGEPVYAAPNVDGWRWSCRLFSHYPQQSKLVETALDNTINGHLNNYVNCYLVKSIYTLFPKGISPPFWGSPTWRSPVPGVTTPWSCHRHWVSLV